MQNTGCNIYMHCSTALHCSVFMHTCEIWHSAQDCYIHMLSTTDHHFVYRYCTYLFLLVPYLHATVSCTIARYATTTFTTTQLLLMRILFIHDISATCFIACYSFLFVLFIELCRFLVILMAVCLQDFVLFLWSFRVTYYDCPALCSAV
jgi:hypothetical protein